MILSGWTYTPTLCSMPGLSFFLSYNNATCSWLYVCLRLSGLSRLLSTFLPVLGFAGLDLKTFCQLSRLSSALLPVIGSMPAFGFDNFLNDDSVCCCFSHLSSTLSPVLGFLACCQLSALSWALMPVVNFLAGCKPSRLSSTLPPVLGFETFFNFLAENTTNSYPSCPAPSSLTSMPCPSLLPKMSLTFHLPNLRPPSPPIFYTS